ncbi:MAG: LytR/AlgR family response regulator transcription factor [Runella sp.]
MQPVIIPHHFPFQINDIVRIEGYGNYSRVINTARQIFTSSWSLCRFEHLPPEFVRVHKRCIVNRRFVVGIVSAARGLLMTDGKVVVVSRRKWKSDFLKNFL